MTIPRASLTLAATMLALALLILAATAAPSAEAAGTVQVNVVGKGDVTGAGVDCDESGAPACSVFVPDICMPMPPIDPSMPVLCIPMPGMPSVAGLTAGPDRDGYEFNRFDGCDSVAARTCSVMPIGPRTVTARFTDVQPPVVTLASPASGVVRGTIGLSANASDNSGTVDRVEFFVRGQRVATDTTAPFSAQFNTASIRNGAAELRAVAFAGAHQTASARGVTIKNTPSVSAAWRRAGVATRVKRLTVKQAPVGGTIALACKGRGCTFKKRTIAIGATTVPLAGRFKKALAPGAVVTVVVKAPHGKVKTVRYTMRARRAPRVKAG